MDRRRAIDDQDSTGDLDRSGAAVTRRAGANFAPALKISRESVVSLIANG